MLRPSSFIRTNPSRNESNTDETSPNSSPSDTSEEISKNLLSIGDYVGGISQTFTSPKRTTEIIDIDSSIRRNSELNQRSPSPLIAEEIEIDKKLVSTIKSWAFEGSLILPGCLNPNFKPKSKKLRESERKISESIVIDEKKSFNELFDSLFSASADEESKEESVSKNDDEQTDGSTSPHNISPPSTTNTEPNGNPQKSRLKTLLLGNKYKPITTAATNIPLIKESPKPQNSHTLSHVPLMDEQFQKTGFKLELTDFQIMENFRDVSRYNRRKDLDEQRRMRNQKFDETNEEREHSFSIIYNPQNISQNGSISEEILKKKKFIEKEIMETEIGYVRNLVNLFEYYLLPIRKNGILTREHYQIVFKNINMILAINSSLLKEFQKAYYSQSSSESLASVFINRIPALKLYVGYVNSYPSAIKCLNEILTKDPAFNSWQKSQRNIEMNGFKLFPLRSYIALPLQRITRYHLLFNDLLGTLQGDEYFRLCAVIDEIKALSVYCIEKKKESENLETLLEIQKKLKLKELVRGDRIFLREGLGHADNGETIVELYLFSDLLVYVMSNDTKRVVKEVPLKAGNLIEMTKVSTTSFLLSFQNEKSCITLDSEDDLDMWMSTINNLLNSSITEARIRRRGNTSTPQKEKIVFAGYLTKTKGLSKKTRFHTLSSKGNVNYYNKPNGELKGSYQITGSKIFKKSPTTFLLTSVDGKTFYYSTENDSIASTWINRFIGLGAVIVKQ